MSNLRAELRRQRRGRERHFPVIPGVVPEWNDEWQRVAMEQAHEDLPPLPNSRVTLFPFKPAEGLEKIREAFGDRAADMIRQELKKIGGSDPHIIIAARVPHEYERHHEACAPC